MNWREIPNCSYETWHTEITEAGGPPMLAAKVSYESAIPMTALCLAMLHAESSYATDFNANKPQNKNPLNLRPRGGAGYLEFVSYADCIRNWRLRLLDPDYAYAHTTTIQDLVHVYAPSTDGNNETAYVASIDRDLARWGIVQEASPMANIYGLVPYPQVVTSHLPASNPFVKTSGAPDIPDAMFWHIMVGSLKGTDGWFHMGKAATAYGIGVASTDGPALAGVIYEWIKPRTGWYGESSGPAIAPYGDGQKFVLEVGASSVNRRSKAIEISGTPDTPLDDKARDAIANMTAYWADQKQIPWETFPMVPGTQRSFVIWHNEITGLAFKTCPGRVVMAETSALIERTRQVLKRYQTSASPPIEPTPEPPPIEPPIEPFPGFTHGLRTGTDQHVGNITYQFVSRLVTVRRGRQAPGYDRPGGTKRVTLTAGTKIRSAFIADIDGKQYLWDDGGTVYSRSPWTPKLTLQRLK